MAFSLARLLPWGKRAIEGQYRPGPYMLSNGWLPAGSGWNYWQTGQNVQPYGGPSAMLEACISAYAQTVPMCPGDHWRSLDDGGRERVTNSALSRILRRPNTYESISDFLMNLTRRLYQYGEAFALAARNSRFEITELHLMRHGSVTIAEGGGIFYSLSGNEVVQAQLDLTMPVPARDVLHVRLHTPRHPLKGESPILAAQLALAMSGAAMSQQIAFYLNQSRPSFILQTDLTMTKEQAEELNQRWIEKTTGENAGKTPIATHGLKAQPIQTSAVDAQLAEMRKMNDQEIALALRIPLQILGLGGTAYASTELLMQSWIATGFGFTINHIEEAMGLLFGLRGVPDEYLEFDTKALLRSAYRERIEALARGVQGGIYSPNEARALEDLPEMAFGDEVRLQQQVVPLSAWAKIGTPAEPSAPMPEAAPAAPPAPAPDTGADTANKLASFRAAYDEKRRIAA